MIKVSSLSHRYGDTLAVDEVSFEINSGEIVGLLGPNGAGKSTIMKILTGFLRPLEGRVELEGQNIWSRISASQAKIGYLPENNVLYEEMTVLDYLGYTAILRGVQENLLPSAIENALKKTDLTINFDICCNKKKTVQISIFFLFFLYTSYENNF